MSEEGAEQPQSDGGKINLTGEDVIDGGDTITGGRE